MAMTFSDVEELIRLLDEHPKLKSELRLRLFEEEWAPFMRYVREVLASSLAAIEELKRQSAAHDQRLEELAAEQASFRTEVDQRFDTVDQRFDAVDQRFDRMQGDIDTLKTDVGALKGDSLENRFCSRAPAFLQQFILRGKLISLDDIPEVYDALEAGKITQQEYDRIVATDAIVRGRKRDTSEITNMVVEVSATIDETDVNRALWSAEILRRLDLPAEPVVFGYVLRPQAKELADSGAVTVLLTGPK